ncbi:hypothetical protein [Methylobacterium brachiatum]|uniref:hypothetical protein n=1 Tax=Methylobacterium brachiatum TaxID=269660 RepID=UPI000EFB9035|nr:hypothetical protein [Methylobacterium brachiatum]AYO83688.1 hypothetical protein EBB05_16370 [Methylobacterium brachiatum]
MIAVSPLHAAISAHRAAYDAYQVAPDDEAEAACCAMEDALDALVVGACAFPILGRPLPEGAGALLAHLRWWLAEEAVHAEEYQPDYGILLGRAADLAAVQGYAPAADPSAGSDPIIAAIVAADMATAAHTACLVHLDEDDDEQVERCNAAAQETDRTFEIVHSMMPATLSGLHALTRFYARDAKLYDRCSGGSEYLAHVARALIACDSVGRFSWVRQLEAQSEQPLEVVIQAGEIQPCSGVPGKAQVEAAWRALPAETRDRIGIIATDLVFQAFVHGDAYVATGSPRDRAVPGRSKAAQAIRDAAADAETARLNELHRVVESALPCLFGPASENPEWAVAMGAKR